MTLTLFDHEYIVALDPGTGISLQVRVPIFGRRVFGEPLERTFSAVTGWIGFNLPCPNHVRLTGENENTNDV